MNTPGETDGILRAWVDGRLAYERTDWRWRHVDTLKIEQIWMNVYHGGTAVSPYDQHLYVDNVVVADRYIGPMNAELPEEPENPGAGSVQDDPPAAPQDAGASGGGSGGGCFIRASGPATP